MSPLDEWQARANQVDQPDLPKRLTRDEFNALPSTKQKAWLKKRKDTMSLPWPTILTPQVAGILDELDQSFEARDRKIGAVNGFVIDGDSGIGKTTLIDLWARETHRKLQAENPERVGKEFSAYAPVISINVPEKPTPATILRRISDFIAIPSTKSVGVDRLKSATVKHLKQLGTEVLVFDEIQHIEFSGRKTTPASIAFLKDLANALDIYMVFAGSNLKHSQLLSPETQEGASPFAARFQSVELLPIVAPSADMTWVAVVKAAEKNLRLLDQGAELHANMSELLWDRASGRIRTLVDLLRKANYKAIKLGEEQIAEHLVRGIRTDSLTQNAA